MTDEERSFNYNDLNLDFLELSPPRAKAVVRNASPMPNSSSFRPSSFKAKQLAQRVAKNDVFVNKIDILKKENFELQQKLKDFKNSAAEIQKLYEHEKQRANNLQIQHDTETRKSNELQSRCGQLNNDIAEKRLQLEQLEAQLDEAKGPLSYIELAIKYLKLFHKIKEDENSKHHLPRDKSLFFDLSKYCEDKGYKVPSVQVSKKKRVYKKDTKVQCNLLEAVNPPSSKETQTVSTQTAARHLCQMQTQTDLATGRDVHTQTLVIETHSVKNLHTKGVQTAIIEMHTQGTQHISTTTTRGTSTSCFIKKHNVGTCFPEAKLVPPVTAMVDELLQLYNVSPVSPISDPLPLTSHNELELPTTPAAALESLSYKSIGTCTYLCNVQRQIDFIPLVSGIKRSESSSPSPFTFANVKNEAYMTPTPSPPPSATQAPTVHNRNDTSTRTATNNNFGNMQPMLNTVAQLPDMPPEMFSSVWQMAGQMFMGLIYPPTNNRLRIAPQNRAQNSLNQEHFHNWISSLYESIHQPNQQSASSPPPHREYQQQVNGSERDVDTEAENNTNVVQSNNLIPREDTPATQDFYDSNTNERIELHHRDAFGTQTDNTISPRGSDICESQNTFADWIFKEPREIPKKSAKQARARKAAMEEASCVKKHRDKLERKKRKKENRKRLAKQMTTTVFNDELNVISDLELNNQQQNEKDIPTAVEFCANLCNLNNYSNDESYWDEMDIGVVNANQSNKQDLSYAVNMETEKLNNSETGVNNNGGKIYADFELKQNEKMGEIREEQAIAQDNTCKDFVHVGFKETDEASKSMAGVNNSCGKVEVNINCKLNGNMNKIIVDEEVKVPDNTLFDSENAKCDNLDYIEAIIETEAQTEPLETEIEFEKNACCIFGSDSEEEAETHLADTQSIEFGAGNSEASMVFKKSVESLDNKEKHVVAENMEEDSRKSTERRDDFCVISPNSEENVSLKQSVTCLSDNKEPEEGRNQILSDLALSDTESEEREAIIPSFELNLINQSRSQSLSDDDESDDPVLVIVEEVSDATNANNFVITYGTRNSQSPNKDPLQQSGSDTDISTLLESAVMDDLLANSSTQKLFNSILGESPNEKMQAITPRRRGRKRNSEASVVSFCKRSERLRAKHDETTQLTSDESLSSPAKYSHSRQHSPEPSGVNGICDDVSGNCYNSSPRKPPHKKLLHSLTKEQINKQFERFIEIRQRVNKIENEEKVAEVQHKTARTEADVNAVCESFPAQTDKHSDVGCASVERVADETSASLRPSPMHATTQQSEPSCSGALPSLEASDQPSTYCLSNTSCHKSEQCPKNDAHISQMDYDTPSSPPPSSNIDVILNKTQPCREIPLELDMSYYSHNRKSVLQYLIYNYSSDIYAIVTGNKNQPKTEKFAVQLEKFLNNTRDRVDILASTLAASLHEEIEDSQVIGSLIVDQISKAPRPEIELGCELALVPRKYIGTHLRLISIVLRHLQYRRADIAAVLLTTIESILFNYRTQEISLSAALNLTQLYLLVIPFHNSQLNSARLYIGKCLYYYNVKAFPMIYEVLCWYPTTLPHRDEPNYDHSDALITVIKHFLMGMTYNMDSEDLRHRELLSLLRYSYHFEPYTPKALEVLCNLVSKLKSGHLTNLKYAFAIFCKRSAKLVDILLQQQLLPLADEYYKLVQHSEEYDERIAALLECISVVVKPLPLDTDVSIYFSIFERFLCAVHRPLVQEATVLAILRLQRFGHNRCFHALAHFKPHYPLQMLTTNVLKTFIHKQPLKYWRDLLKQPLNNQC
ncbi:uncharacterized protein LOC118743073 [Rhagoletis pomonella]|uniref:uncharacterized protein LOC118743073 n=1 Tax=Rhagoletis pomonella TaxID=28610 RepID=UPI0017874C71|nr:uncharacterized protein LOC118743073 [Rhagoletis pomonella]